jgi:integrase
MGRYPWRTFSKLLIEERADWSRTKEGTARAMERKLRYLEGVVRSLHEQGAVSTMNPAKLTEGDIKALFRYLKEDRHLKPNSLRKYLTAITQLTVYAGNPTIATMRAHPVKAQQLPRGSDRSGRKSYNLETVKAFLDAARARAEASKDWYETASYGFAVLAAGFGLRPKELRALRYGDLERFCWRLKVDYSKTHPDYTALLPPIRPHVERYLELRAAALRQAGHDPEATGQLMVPNLGGRGIRHPSPEGFEGPQLRKMFEGLRQGSGITIAPKDLRTSFGQILKDAGASMDDCSSMLRHNSVQTTQRFYVELRPQDTFNKLEKLFPDSQEGDLKPKIPQKSIPANWENDYRR